MRACLPYFTQAFRLAKGEWNRKGQERDIEGGLAIARSYGHELVPCWVTEPVSVGHGELL